MSREINLTEKLSDEDREYLLARGREQEVTRNDAEFTEDAAAKRAASYIPGTSVDQAEGVPVTEGGDPLVNNGGGTVEGLPTFAQRGDQAIKGEAFDAGIGALAHASEDGQEQSDPSKYEGLDKKALVAEIERRNAEYSDDYQLPTSGSKTELVARLVADDNTPDEDDDEDDSSES